MTQPDTGARERGDRVQNVRAAAPAVDGPVQPGRNLAGHGLEDQQVSGQTLSEQDLDGQQLTGPDQAPALPPGQYIPRALPVLHYGPVPTFRAETWDLRILGATESGAETSLCWHDVAALPVTEITADFHCVTKFTVAGVRWRGVPAAEILRRFPPAAAVTHVMIWAEFGYSANIRISDFAADQTLLATHRDCQALSPEHGYPLRLVVPHLYAWKSVKWVRALEYLTSDRRGFWEERGYHNVADPWREQRYSYQECDGEGPPL
jgi:DMSO/TMAO reductase YedYZ molybdopterin-dependent catalytic subunit